MWIDDTRLVISVERERHHQAGGGVDAATPGRGGWPWPPASSSSTGTRATAAVRPTAREVAYVFYPRADLNRSEIRVAALDGGEVARAHRHARMHDNEPAWSPDGGQIVYASERSGFYELHLVGRDGADERQLTDARADHTEIDWHPDGDRLAVTRGRRNRYDLVVVDTESGEAEVLAEGGLWSRPQWTRGGSPGRRRTRTTPPRPSCGS